MNLELKISAEELRKKLDIQDGKTPTSEELLKLITPLIPKAAPAPTNKELLELINPLIPEPVPGNDGSPDSPDEVVEKINQATTKIDPKQIKGLTGIYKFVDEYGTNPTGPSAGGGPTYRFLSNGVVVSAHVTEINFGAGITPVYSGNGRITITAVGGGASTTYTETPAGAINDVNTTYTVAHTITTVLNFNLNGQFIHPAEYSVNDTTITFITPPPASLSGTGFTITYQ